MKPLSIPELLNVTFPNIAPIIHPHILVPKGRMEIYGKPGIYKSFLGQQLVFCVVCGNPWCGYQTSKVEAALYLQAEIAEVKLQERVQAMLRGGAFNKADLDRVFLATEADFSFDGVNEFKELAETVKAIHASVVVIDPVYMFMAGEENAGKDTRFFLKGLNYVIEESGTAIVIIHHQRKAHFYMGNATDTGMDESKGHSNLTQWPDTVMGVRWDRGNIMLRWEKMRHGERLSPRTVRFAGGMLQPLGTDVAEVIMGLVSYGPMKQKDLITRVAEDCNITIDWARKVKDEMIKEGRVLEVLDANDRRCRMIRRVDNV